MNTITHALIPVIAVAVIEKVYAEKKDRRGLFSNKEIALIALAGAAPDLLNPHFTLESRLNSWSHSPFFWLCMSAVLLLLCLIKSNKKKRFCSWQTALSASIGYGTHLFCDAIAGGITWNYPFGNHIIGGYYIPVILWVPIDILLIIYTYWLFRAAHLYRNLKRSI